MQLLNDMTPWWGMTEGQPRSLAELVANGTLTVDAGAMLWWAMERGVSLLVAALPRLAGKTTLATSLLPFLPPDARLYTVAGPHDPVAPGEGDGPLYLLINELSDHTPLYVWGAAARRSFALAERGARLLGTLHADGADHAAAVLMGEHGLPAAQAARVDLVVTLRARRTPAGIERRVVQIGLLGVTAGRLTAVPVAAWDAGRAGATPPPEGIAALAARSGVTAEQARRAINTRSAVLAGLVGRQQLEWTSMVESARTVARQEADHATT